MLDARRSDQAALVRAGLHTTVSRRWDLEARTPVVFRSGHGAVVTDVDGRSYVDLTSCRGAAPLGMGYEPVNEAVAACLREGRGILPGTLNEDRLALAEDLLDVLPFGDRVVFTRTGSCATTAAVRLARVATGRRLVLTSGFHGWHDWHLAEGRWGSAGRRDSDVLDFGYDVDVLERILGSRRDEVACVIVTPEPDYFPPAFHQDLAALCRAAGIALVLDEVMSGFRFALGGLAGALDLDVAAVTVSKGLANGMALSAVVGEAWLLGALDETYLGHTFQREVAPYVAGRVTQDAVRDGMAIGRMHETGERLMSGINDVFERRSIPAAAIGWPTMFSVVFEQDTLGKEVYAHWLEGGVLAEFGGTHLPSAALTPQQVQEAVDALEEACGRAAGSVAVPERAAGGRITLARLVEVGGGSIGATPSVIESWAPGHVERLQR